MSDELLFLYSCKVCRTELLDHISEKPEVVKNTYSALLRLLWLVRRIPFQSPHGALWLHVASLNIGHLEENRDSRQG
jgi:hypothetical protein